MDTKCHWCSNKFLLIEWFTTHRFISFASVSKSLYIYMYRSNSHGNNIGFFSFNTTSFNTISFVSALELMTSVHVYTTPSFNEAPQAIVILYNLDVCTCRSSWLGEHASGWALEAHNASIVSMSSLVLSRTIVYKEKVCYEFSFDVFSNAFFNHLHMWQAKGKGPTSHRNRLFRMSSWSLPLL